MSSRTVTTPRICRMLACCLALLLGACNAPPDAVLRIGTNVWPGYEPLYLARDLGWLGDQVHMVEHTSSSNVMRDFRNEAIEAAALTLDEALQLAQDGVDLRIALVMDISDGADVIIARPAVSQLIDLRDKRVGVENTALGAYVLARALESAGLGEGDIRIVSRKGPELETAFLKNEVDAVVTFEPVRSRLLSAGGRVIFDSRQIPGEIVDVLIVRGSYWDAHPALITALADTWFRALDYLRDEPADAARRIAPRMQLSPEEVTVAYVGLQLPDRAENRRLLVPGPAEPALFESTRRLASVMLDHRLLNRRPAMERLFPQDADWLATD